MKETLRRKFSKDGRLRLSLTIITTWTGVALAIESQIGPFHWVAQGPLDTTIILCIGIPLVLSTFEILDTFLKHCWRMKAPFDQKILGFVLLCAWPIGPIIYYLAFWKRDGLRESA